MDFLISVLLLGFSFLILIASIAIFRAKSSAEMIQTTRVVNYYLLPCFVISIELQDFTWQAFIKAIILSILIIIIGNISCGLIAKKQ